MGLDIAATALTVCGFKVEAAHHACGAMDSFCVSGESRFIKSKFKAPKPLKEVLNNKDDAVSALIARIPSDANGLSVYDPRCGDRIIDYWDVNKHQM